MSAPTEVHVVHRARIVDGPAVEPDAWLARASGRVVARGRGTSWRDAPGLAVVDARDAAGAYAAPGLVDLHCHGGGGVAFEEAVAADDRAGFRRALTAHRDTGTTHVVASLVSDTLDRTCAALERLARWTVDEPGLLGTHLEGPFLASGRCGAHDPAALRAPDATAVDRLLAAAGGTLVQVTIAPELPGALAAVEAFAAAGVRVAVGHTDADADGAAAAYDRGASLLTHAFNAMPPLLHRAPGPVGAALERDGVSLEVIADGEHVAPVLLRTLLAAAPGRVVVVSDATAAAGGGDGRYRLGDLDVDVVGGVPRIAGTSTLAGSGRTLGEMLPVLVAAGVPLPVAVEAMTAAPARAVGRPLGRLDVGSPGAVVLVGDDGGVLDVLP